MRVLKLVLDKPNIDLAACAQVFGAERFQAAQQLLAQRKANPAHRVEVLLEPLGTDIKWTAQFSNGLEERGISSNCAWARKDAERVICESIGVAQDVVIDYTSP